MKVFKSIIFVLLFLICVYLFPGQKKHLSVKYAGNISYNKRQVKITPKNQIKPRYIKNGDIYSYYKFYYKNGKIIKLERVFNGKVKRYKTFSYRENLLYEITQHNAKGKVQTVTRYSFRKDKTVYRSIVYFRAYSRYIIRIHGKYGHVTQIINEPL